MDLYKYKPIDLGDRSLRLVRLFKGEDGPIKCELFNAWCHEEEYGIEYEALSYTWGGLDKPYDIEIDCRRMPVTENLLLALRHLRYPDQDRILWIDAICIDQENPKEQGHQVRQMASIYKRAEQVIIWLGRATSNTDLVLRALQKLEKETIKHACNSWTTSDERWLNLWSSVQPQLGDLGGVKSRLQEGLKTLLERSWFKRVWIIQEVACARAAKVICGAASVSTRIFSLAPILVESQLDPHCQAILDIMPGPARKHSWWIQKRDLRSLLLKFKGSEATQSRDIVYALLGISSDGSDTNFLIPDYEKSLDEVISDTISFMLHFHECKSSVNHLPKWTLAELLQNLNFLGNVLFEWAVEWNDQAMREHLVQHNELDINWKSSDGHTPLSRMVESQDISMVRLILEHNDVGVDLSDRNNKTPLLKAVEKNQVAIAKLLIDNGANVDRYRFDHKSETPLLVAVENGQYAMAKLLVEKGANVDFQGGPYGTSLQAASYRGDEKMVQLLLDNGADVNASGGEYGNPLQAAVEKGYEQVVKLLLNKGANVNAASGDYGNALYGAVAGGYEQIIKLLVDRGAVQY